MAMSPIGLRRLGRSGLHVSEIGFGCGVTAGLMIKGSPKARRAAVARALELGIDYFDTAPVYGDTASETNLGRTLRELNARPTIATKVVLGLSDLGDVKAAVIRSAEASLERLGLTRATVLQLHNRVADRRAARADIGVGAQLSLDDVLGPDGVAEAFGALRRRGLFQLFGCCAYGGHVSAVERLIDSGKFDTILVNYSMLNPTAWQPPPGGAWVRDYGRVGARAAKAGLGTVALRVLEGGVLASAAERHPRAGGANRSDPAQTARARVLRERLRTDGANLADTAIRFALSNPEVSTVLIGFSDSRQIEAAAAAAAAGALDPSMLTRITQPQGFNESGAGRLV